MCIRDSLKTSWLNTIDFVRIVRLSLQMLVTGQAGMDDLSGPVGIVSTITQVGTASETIAAAVENILYFGAMLAVNLAVMNMLPIPALDGGKIFFLIIDEIEMCIRDSPRTLRRCCGRRRSTTT